MSISLQSEQVEHWQKYFLSKIFWQKTTLANCILVQQIHSSLPKSIDDHLTFHSQTTLWHRCWTKFSNCMADIFQTFSDMYVWQTVDQWFLRDLTSSACTSCVVCRGKLITSIPSFFFDSWIASGVKWVEWPSKSSKTGCVYGMCFTK